MAKQIVTDIAAVLRERVPGPDITPDRLGARDWWWSGPELFLFDDYDLLASFVIRGFQDQQLHIPW